MTLSWGWGMTGWAFVTRPFYYFVPQCLDYWLALFFYWLNIGAITCAIFPQDGCIVCPSTDSTFDLRTGAVRDWYPKNPVLRALTPILRTLYIYPVKTDGENIYISLGGGANSDASAEIVFSGRAQPGATATNVNVEEVWIHHKLSQVLLVTSQSWIVQFKNAGMNWCSFIHLLALWTLV